MTQAKTLLFVGEMETTEAEKTGTCKVDSAVTIIEDLMLKGSTAMATIQMSDTMYVLYAALQDKANNNGRLQCINFRT